MGGYSMEKYFKVFQKASRKSNSKIKDVKLSV